jgi:alginate O-acetyltransferase complex protein AlgI
VIFNSLTFLLFLCVVLLLYWALPRRSRLWMLFLASLTFYGFWRVEFLPVMLLSTVVDYVAARSIAASGSPARKRAWLGLSLVVNLGLLFYFKYLIFFADNVTGLLRFLGFDVAEPAFSIILPLGISFYTFQTISYTVDVYRGFLRPEKDFVLYGCFVTYFPQLVAGPVLRAREVIPQLSTRPPFHLEDLAEGARRVLSGLFLKVVLADNLAPLVDAGFDQSAAMLGALDVWTLAFLFGFQIYFDFSGYSHIALGCARMMGIRFPENFAFPYLSTSPRDFWRRWHISLSSWIRDYLYLPLAGERVADRSVGGLAVAMDERRAGRRDRALFLTWAIMGLWHGAAWTFVFWGLYHACLVYGHRRLAPLFAGWPARLRGLAGFGVTLPLAMLGWVPFRAQGLGTALEMLGRVFQPASYLSLGMRENTYLVAALVLLLVIAAYLTREHAAPRLARYTLPWAALRTLGYAVAAALVFVFLRPINQFIYFQF